MRMMNSEVVLFMEIYLLNHKGTMPQRFTKKYINSIQEHNRLAVGKVRVVRCSSLQGEAR